MDETYIKVKGQWRYRSSENELEIQDWLP
jgi:transposase-like protein